MSSSNAISNFRITFIQNKWLWCFTVLFFTLWVTTFVGTTDLANWFMENALVFGFLIFLFFPAQALAYLGTQGDIWDAQKDIFLATLGAILATTIVSILKIK